MTVIEAKKILLAAELDPLVREAINVLSPDLDFENLPGEEWRDVTGEVVEFKDNYQVSTRGRVRSFYNGKVKILKLHDAEEYFFVELKKKGQSRKIKIHRLVACTFIPNPDNKPYVNHLNGDKHNNCVENLAWVTASENVQHAYDSGLRKGSSENFKAKMEDWQVREIRTKCIPGDSEFGFHAFGRRFNVAAAVIRTAFYGKTYKNVD